MDDVVFGIATGKWIAVATITLAIMAIIQGCIYFLMHRTTKAAERGWISLDRLHLLDFDLAKQPVMVLGLRNSGRTPAFIQRAKVRLWISAQALPDVSPLDDMPDATAFPRVVVSDETTNWRHRDSDYIVDVPDFGNVMNDRTHVVWVIGQIWYKDAFSQHVRFTKFARQWTPFEPSLQEKPEWARFAFVDKPGYNDAT